MRKSLLGLVSFLVVAGFLAVMELTTLTGPHTGTTDTYHAVFSTPDGVSGLRSGNPVRVAGVPVGKVTGIDLVNATSARVTFTANRNQQLTSRTYASVRYANLLGQRFLALSRGSGPAGTTLRPGSTIPASRTMPALSLTDLFNGFRPLFSALTPNQVNELSQDIIDVLQGETSRIDDLVARTASLTTNLADRNNTFAQVLSQLSTLLRTMAEHDNQLAGVITTLHALTSALHRDGPAITGSLDAVDQLIGSTGGLLGKLETHSLPADIDNAAALTDVLARNTPTVTNLVSGFASAFQTFTRITQNGSWVNVYLCNLTTDIHGTASVGTQQVIVDGLGALLGENGGGLSGTLQGILGSVGLGQLSVPVPLTLPEGKVGGSDQHTAVCG